MAKSTFSVGISGNVLFCFARSCNQQLAGIYKDSTGVHIRTKHKTLIAGKDVSMQLTDPQNAIVAIQNIQDVQNVAIAVIGRDVSKYEIRGSKYFPRYLLRIKWLRPFPEGGEVHLPSDW